MFICNPSNNTVAVGQWLLFLSHYVLLPTYIVCGLLGNVVLLIAFYKHSRVEPTYVYQVMLTAGKTLEVITFGGYAILFNWATGVQGEGWRWFRQNYTLMLLTFRIGPPGHIHVVISSALLTVAMSADRVFALAKPFRYKKINSTRHQVIAGLMCSALPALSSVSYLWSWEIGGSTERYAAIFNFDFNQSVEGRFFTALGQAMRMISVALVIILNIAMVVLFRKRNTTIAQMTNCSQKDAIRKAADKTLILLNIYQSVLMLFNQAPHSIFQISTLTSMDFLRCHSYGVIASSVADAGIFITTAIDIVVITTINKKIRDMIRNAFRC